MSNQQEKRKEKELYYRRRRWLVFGGGLALLILIVVITVFAVKWSGASEEDASSAIVSSEVFSSSEAVSSEASSSEVSSSEVSSSEASSSEASSSSKAEPKPKPKPKPKPQPEKKPDPKPKDGDPVAQKQADDWRLILVNRGNPLQKGYEDTITLETISGNYKFDSRAADSLRKMLADAKADGHPMVLRSTYRLRSRSEYLYNNKVQEYRNAGYSQERAEAEAAKWIAPPGTSEHHTGLAVDLVDTEYNNDEWDLLHKFENYPGFEWLITHCTDYGFVLRYPKDKQDITGVTYEPWHYRWVGVEHAKYMEAHNLCLEEYVAQLTK